MIAEFGRPLKRSLLAHVIHALVTLFFVSTMLVPTTIVNKAVFGILVVVTLVRLATRPGDSWLPTVSPFVAAVIFAYGFLLSLMGRSDPTLAKQFLLSVAVLFLIYPVMWYDIDLDYVAKLTGLTLVVFTALYFVAVVGSLTSGAAAALLEWFTDNNLGRAAHREFLNESGTTFALGTGTFLLLPLTLFVVSLIERRSLAGGVAVLVISVAIVVSGSRGLMLTSLVAVAFVVMQRAGNVSRMAMVILAVPIVVYALGFLVSSTQVFSAAEESNSIKIGHVRSFLDHLSLPGALFGEGLASFYFSSGRGSQVPHTEIALLDMLRYFGFILTPVLYASLLFPSMRLNRYCGDRALSVGIFLAYLVLSNTNPVLFNSAGLLVVVWYWHKILMPLPRATSRRSAPPLAAM